MDLDDYTALLTRARGELPEHAHNRDRWTLPIAELQREGRMTVFRNFREIVNELRRDEDHVAKYLLQQIGTAGQIDGDRLIFTGKLDDAQVMGRLQDYVATYVQCVECGSPDTHLERDERVQVIQCDACGARTPVKARKGAAKARAGPQVREGAVLDVTIQSVGSRGEGKAAVEGYTIIVPKTEAGAELKIKITRLAGKLAFGEVVA